MKVDIASEAVQVRDISYIKIDKVLQRGRKYYKLTLMVKEIYRNKVKHITKKQKEKLFEKGSKKGKGELFEKECK